MPRGCPRQIRTGADAGELTRDDLSPLAAALEGLEAA
jgi:hypothetical protein